MSTQTKTSDPLNLNGTWERWTDATRKAGNDYLDAYGKGVDQWADFNVKTAAATKLPVVAEIAEAQAQLARSVAETQIRVTRDLIKA